jgi:hypothetical protein
MASSSKPNPLLEERLKDLQSEMTKIKKLIKEQVRSETKVKKLARSQVLTKQDDD